METLKEVIESNSPHEITIYETGNSTPIIYQEDVIYFCSKYTELLERKVKDWDMTMERFMYVRLY